MASPLCGINTWGASQAMSGIPARETIHLPPSATTTACPLYGCGSPQGECREVSRLHVRDYWPASELAQGMAGKNPALYQRMLDEIGAYARLCDKAGYAGIGIPEHHLQIEGFELGQDPGLMAMYMGMQTKRLRINQFGYVLPTHNPLRVAEHAATLDHMLGGRLNVAFVRGYQARWFENYVAVPGSRPPARGTAR